MEKINPEEFDNKVERLLLSEVLKNEKIIEKIYSINNIFNKSYEKLKSENSAFFKSIHKILWYKENMKIWEDKKQDISMLLFWENIKNESDLKNIILKHSENIDKFLNSKLNNKWLIFLFIELIIERIANIDNKYFDFFKEENSNKKEFLEIIEEYIILSLDNLEKDTNNILKWYINFIDTHLKKDSNYLDDIEFENFKNDYNKLISTYLASINFDEELKSKISKVEKKIENFISFD